MEEKINKSNKAWGAVFLAVLALAATLAVFLYTQGREDDNTASGSSETALTEPMPLPVDEEELVDFDWLKYSDDDAMFNFPKGWYEETENGFVTFSSWDKAVSPERGQDGLRLVIGKVKSDMPLEQYVEDYLFQNLTGDPSYDLLGRRQAMLGGQPALFLQAETSLEGGSVIQSMFTKFEGEIWSVDVVGTVLDEDLQEVFDQVVSSFTFQKAIIMQFESLNNNEETYDESGD